LTKIFGKIDRALIDFQQRLGRRPFGIDHVVAFELDMKKLQLTKFSRVINGLYMGDRQAHCCRAL
jgi:hypothetical protein